MTKITQEQQKQEALERMRSLELAKKIIKQFEENDIVHVCVDPHGASFPASDRLMMEIRRFEQENDALVYLVVRTGTFLGTLDSMLFVGPYVEDWETDRTELEDGYVMTYTQNWAFAECSEMGSIAFRKHPGIGITRIG